MRKEATFRSSAFNTSEVRPYFINDCCFGDDVARWMIGRLRSAGVDTDDEPGQEDFGWYFEFSVPSGRHCCVLGYRPDDDVWLMWLERSRGFFGSILGMLSRGIEGEAVRVLNDVLTGASEIEDLHWHDEYSSSGSAAKRITTTSRGESDESRGRL